ncbi:MAG: hypothetical protein K5683_02005 [Prevotella sp.]|nr:hypothetical protein [Prevotella sp.]
MINSSTLSIKSGYQLTTLASSLHFVVDGLCACCLFLVADGANIIDVAGVIMVYNVLAFLTQPLTGMLADRHPHHQMLLQGAVVLLSLGVMSGSLCCLSSSLAFSYLVAVLLGLGNSLFHVWGGKRVATVTGNDIRALGIFVAPGALGLVVGMLFRSWWLLYVLLGVLALLTVWASFISPAPPMARESVVRPAPVVWLSIIVLMAIVSVRSLLGETFSADLTAWGVTALVVGAVAMLGKMVGGFVARAAGIGWALALMVTGVALCLFFRHAAIAMSWAGLLVVNMTMAVTLWLANHVLQEREGLAFGLLAASLMPGYLLAQLSTSQGGDAGMEIAWLLMTLVPTIIIELIVLWALREKRGEVLWSAVVVNMLTNVPLNLFVTYISDSLLTIVVGELLVLVVEALWYAYFVRNWRQAFIYSLLCNGISFFTGLLVQLLIALVHSNT